MSFDYSKSAATALKLLTKFGGDVTLKRDTGDSTHPITGAITAGTDASVTTTGLLVNYKNDAIDGTRIMSGDKQLILSNEQAVTMTDKPTINGENWSIVAIETVKPFDTIIIYKVQVRK